MIQTHHIQPAPVAIYQGRQVIVHWERVIEGTPCCLVEFSDKTQAVVPQVCVTVGEGTR